MSIIADQNGDEYEWVECPVCVGVSEDDMGESCGYCDGRGEVREYYPAYDEDPTTPKEGDE